MELKILNLSANRKLEIRPQPGKEGKSESLDLSTFGALMKLRVLDVSELKATSSQLPEESFDRRVRCYKHEPDVLPFGVADLLGRQTETLNIWDFVITKYLGREKEYLCGLFDGRDAGTISKFLYESFSFSFSTEMRKLKKDEDVSCALRRTFLTLNKDIGMTIADFKDR